MKAKTKAIKKATTRAAARPKSIRIKVKQAKSRAREAGRSTAKSGARVAPRRASAAVSTTPTRPAEPSRERSRQFQNAVHTYETAIKLMHAEEFAKAKQSFESLLVDHPEETEIQERAKVLITACEKKIQEKARTVFRSADDHYNVGIADLNRRALDSAVQHLQHALKLMPKADHVLYALAAASALQGNREQSLNYLKQAIHYHPENRFLALRDSDFETLHEDPDFKQLVTFSEK